MFCDNILVPNGNYSTEFKKKILNYFTINMAMVTNPTSANPT